MTRIPNEILNWTDQSTPSIERNCNTSLIYCASKYVITIWFPDSQYIFGNLTAVISAFNLVQSIKMATMRLLTVKNLSKFLLNGRNSIQIRCQSSNFQATPVGGISHMDKVITIEDNSMYVSLHPTAEFPYEYSRPLPPPAIPTSTLLKDEAITRSMEAFTRKHPEMARRELERVTYTSKHVWRPTPVRITRLNLIRKNLYKKPTG